MDLDLTKKEQLTSNDIMIAEATYFYITPYKRSFINHLSYFGLNAPEKQVVKIPK